MENISPQLSLILAVKFGFQNGLSLRQSLIIYFNKDLDFQWKSFIQTWLKTVELKQPPPVYKRPDHLTSILMETLNKGLNHQPILEMLDQLEEEVIARDQIYLQRQIAILPIKSLIPLLLLQVPALIIMVFVPLIDKLSF
jgi:hypothetical protein